MAMPVPMHHVMQMQMPMAGIHHMAGIHGAMSGAMGMPGGMPMQGAPPMPMVGVEGKDMDDRKARKGGGKAKGCGKGSRPWAGAASGPGFVPHSNPQPNLNSKGNGKKGMWKFVSFRPKLTEEEMEERRKANAEKHEKRIEDEERQVLTQDRIKGEVVQRAKWHAWIKPENSSEIPAEAREKLAEMNTAFRAKVTDGRSFCGGVEGDVLYLAVADIAEEKLVLRAGLVVEFKVYVDNKGVGACDVVAHEASSEKPPSCELAQETPAS